MYNYTFAHMNDKNEQQIEQYYDYIDEYYSHQPEAKRPALPRLPTRTKPDVVGNKSASYYQKKKTILPMNTSKIIRGFFHWIAAYMLINIGLVFMYLMLAAFMDLNSPQFTHLQLSLMAYGQILVALVAVLWASEEIEREGHD